MFAWQVESLEAVLHPVPIRTAEAAQPVLAMVAATLIVPPSLDRRWWRLLEEVIRGWAATVSAGKSGGYQQKHGLVRIFLTKPGTQHDGLPERAG